MDPDSREWRAGAKPRPPWTPPQGAPAETEDMRAAMQQLHDDLYEVLSLFWRGIHLGEPVREGRIREADLYTLHDRLSEVRRKFGLEGR